jgi:hypothetical protein
MVDIKWSYVSDYEKKIVFKSLEEYLDPIFQSKTKKEKLVVLKELFEAYNQYVVYRYQDSAMTCGSCVSTVTGFFKTEYKKWQTEKK